MFYGGSENALQIFRQQQAGSPVIFRVGMPAGSHVLRSVIRQDEIVHFGQALLPNPLHRFRGQLRLTAVLASALLLTLLWSCGSERWREFNAYRGVVAETKELRRKNDSMQSALKRAAREQKDIAKLLNSNFGEGDVIGQLAALSQLLPQDVMVTDFRWNESGIDLVLQSESENLDLPRVLKPLSHWKVTDIQQRQGRMSAITTVTAKLIPVEQAAVKGKAGKNAKSSRRSRK